MSRRRRPSDDDLDLWKKVVETVKPLKPVKKVARLLATPGEEKKPEPAPGKTRTRPAVPLPGTLAKRPVAPAPSLPSLSPIDRRMRSRLQRGTLPIDARIDLHGLTQAAAHTRLIRFLEDTQARGARLVLVITGKGRGTGEGDRGVLRRSVPHWLSSRECRNLVIGFEPAGRAHGGEGALYVRIRRAGRGAP